MIILLLIGSYLFGNLLTAKIVIPLFFKKAKTNEETGNPGARNMGRVFGKKAFVVTFLGDAAKGLIVVFTANFLGFGTTIELLALLAVMIGHIYPVFYKFQGGRGISTFIGGILAFNPALIVLLLGVFLIIYPFTKSFTKSGLPAIALIPFGVFMRYEDIEFILSFVMVVLLFFAYRENFIRKKPQANK